ncbi:hypothetical protein VTN77DRAFT_5014 [Rasamsonia byssochlamydoides]|uniref:uncharacterized protein n=1 Tax=Rasamsonia byssochlamydoides TaxID=89139 RepID=UPI003742B5D4
MEASSTLTVDWILSRTIRRASRAIICLTSGLRKEAPGGQREICSGTIDVSSLRKLRTRGGPAMLMGGGALYAV